eukprot:11170079-Karenia_brevis.AAC.1
MVEHGKAVLEQNTNQAQGLSHSGKNQAAALGQPYVVCSNFHAKKCSGWTCLEALATNPFRACGTPFIIARKAIKYWE